MSHADTGPTEVDRYRLDPVIRRAVQARVTEQIHQAWSLAEVAGIRLAPWARHENRELVLQRRLDEMSDTEMFELWDGRRPEEPEVPPAPVVRRADIVTMGRIQLHVPGYLLAQR